MKKSDQIRALQAECDRLAKERDDALREAREWQVVVARRTQPAAPSLAAQARRQLRSWRDGLLDAVGL